MSRQFGGWLLALILGVTLSAVAEVEAESRPRPDTHPCTGADIPLSDERSVVQAAECLFNGRVVKVERVGSSDQWAYRLRILLNEGRVRTVDFNPETGLPTDPQVLEEVYEAADR